MNETFFNVENGDALNGYNLTTEGSKEGHPPKERRQTSHSHYEGIHLLLGPLRFI